jgi:signal transduction histidine kinase
MLALRESEERQARRGRCHGLHHRYSGSRYICGSWRSDISGSNPWKLRDFDPISRVPPERRAAARSTPRVWNGANHLAPLEHRIPRLDGSEMVLETSLSHTKIGGAPALISYTRDITERIALQAELMKQDRLVSVGMLAAGVAHELNNPLTCLGMQARTLRDEAERHGLSSEVQRTLEQMDEAASRMQAIIQDLCSSRGRRTNRSVVDVAQADIDRRADARARRLPTVQIEAEPLPPIRVTHPSSAKVPERPRNAVQAVEKVPKRDRV